MPSPLDIDVRIGRQGEGPARLVGGRLIGVHDARCDGRHIDPPDPAARSAFDLGETEEGGEDFQKTVGVAQRLGDQVVASRIFGPLGVLQRVAESIQRRPQVVGHVR